MVTDDERRQIKREILLELYAKFRTMEREEMEFKRSEAFGEAALVIKKLGEANNGV